MSPVHGVPPFRVLELDHLVLRVANLEAALGFYVGILGSKLERALPDAGLYQLRAGSHLIDLVPIGTQLGGTAPRAEGINVDHFCLNLDPFDETLLLDWLHEHGVQASEPTRRYGAHGLGTSIYVADPDGNTVELKSGAPVL